MSLDAHVVVERPSGFRLDIELEVAAGRTVALLGPNGAGKSTAVAVLAGLTPLHAGRIRLGGHVLDEPGVGAFTPPELRRVGVVFQDYLLFPHLNVAANVGFGLRSRGMSRVEIRTKVHGWLDRFGIADLAAARPGELSGGQAQRVALARALVAEPALLLLDEPLSALDVATRAELRRTLADHLAAFAGPRLLITHEPTEAFLLADEVYVIEDGSITQVGTPDDIRLRPRTRYAADLAGANLIVGNADNGVVSAGDHRLTVADTAIAGPVLATIHPTAIALYRRAPEGSPRNTWRTTVVRIEHYGERVRIQTGPPLPLTAEVTPGAIEALDLGRGSSVWVVVKATEIGVSPAS